MRRRDCRNVLRFGVGLRLSLCHALIPCNFPNRRHLRILERPAGHSANIRPLSFSGCEA